jgi:hydrogenase/urease accessory protein HupE
VTRRSTVLTATDRTARQVVLIGAGENAPQALLGDTHTTVTLSAAAPPLWTTMRRYLVTGIEHIFLGYDHIAFLIAIVLWAQRLRPVIEIVTAFTIAHSVTLSLAALQIVVVPSTIVEPAIAASIVFVALENFFSRDVGGRWRVTFAFGLIHGFGFAGALQEFGLPTNAVVPALAAFNIGVEIGQVVIVSLVVPALEQFPVKWAHMQDNFGNAPEQWSARQEGAARLEQALGAYREAPYGDCCDSNLHGREPVPGT